MGAKPLIETGVMTEFGAVLDDPAFYEVAGVGRDHTYVPGYSDLRRARDLAVGQARRGEIKASAVPTLPVRLQWVRTVRTTGTPDNTKEMDYGQEGYREVMKADISQPWLTDLPPGAKVVSGGSIRKGDVTLMVCDAPRAARNAAAAAFQTRRMTEEAPAAPLMAEGARVRGTDPYIESKLAERPIGAP